MFLPGVTFQPGGRTRDAQARKCQDLGIMKLRRFSRPLPEVSQAIQKLESGDSSVEQPANCTESSRDAALQSLSLPWGGTSVLKLPESPMLL